MQGVKSDYVPEFLFSGWRSKPWMKFYVSDWRADPQVQALDFEERGFYFELLCLDAQQGYVLEVDPTSARLLADLCLTSARSTAEVQPKYGRLLAEVSQTLARLMGKDRRRIRRLFGSVANHFFVTSEGHLINKRLEKERRDAREDRERKSGIPEETREFSIAHQMSDVRCQMSDDEEPPLPPKGGERERDGASLDFEEIRAAWNERLAPLVGAPEIRSLTKTRRRALRARLKESPKFLDDVATELAQVRQETIQLGFLTFDWLLRPSNLTKLLEGNYRDRSPANGAGVDLSAWEDGGEA